MGKKKDSFKEQYEDSVRRAEEIREEMCDDINMRCLSGRIERLTKLYKEIEREIDSIKEDLADLQMSDYSVKEEVKIEPPNKRWRAKEGEPYWYMKFGVGLLNETSLCNKSYESHDNMDNYLYSIGNYFKTKEEVVFEYQRLKVINELKAWSTDKAGIQYIICCVVDNTYPLKPEHELKVVKSHDYLALRFAREPVYFYTKEDAENAIKAVGEERILKYYFIKDLSNNKEEEN